MPSHWTGSTASIIRLRPGLTIIQRAARAKGAVRLVTTPALRRIHVNHAQPTHSSTVSLPDGERSAEKADSKPVEPSSFSIALYLDSFRTRLKERANLLASAGTPSLAEIGGQLNKVTGYEHIEELKRKVVENEAAITVRRQASRDAKVAYETAVAKRSNSQREVNDMLQRKSTWTESDLGLFTILVREDHQYEQNEARAKAQVAVAETELEAGFNELLHTILNRYHEEQIWSDKIRSASTYGSLLALGVNIFVFILAIIVVEPWKRRRLAQTFEKRIEELSLENREMLGTGMRDLAEHFEKQERVLAQPTSASLPTNLVDHEATAPDEETTAGPALMIEKTAKAARDRDLWIAGAAGAVGGGILTLALGYFR